MLCVICNSGATRRGATAQDEKRSPTRTTARNPNVRSFTVNTPGVARGKRLKAARRESCRIIRHLGSGIVSERRGRLFALSDACCRFWDSHRGDPRLSRYKRDSHNQIPRRHIRAVAILAYFFVIVPHRDDLIDFSGFASCAFHGLGTGASTPAAPARAARKIRQRSCIPVSNRNFAGNGLAVWSIHELPGER